MKKSKSHFNSRLRNARVERAWSQQQLADKVGTTSVNISRWENSSHFPSSYFREKLCQVFGKTPAELGLVPTPPPVPHASRIWTVPMRRNPFFTGRESLLALLHERLSTSKIAALIQAQALYGLGGIGKTQIAAEYAFRYGDDHTHVLWTRAATRETLAADFVKLAQLLHLPEKDGKDQPQIVAAVKRWLAANENWLLILDNADDLPLAQEFLPAEHKGYVLFTTRDQAAGAIAASVEVEQLTPQEGTLLLLRCSKRLDVESSLANAQAADRITAERIVEAMDGLPLAIVQAGAYMEETGCSLEDYLLLYGVHHKELLARHSRLLLDYPDTVATTWSLAFQRVEQQSSVAADALRLCAFLAADAIPEELLKGLLTQRATESDAVPEAGIGDSLKLNEALGALLRYSLVRRDARAHMISIHRLVQIVLKDSLDEEAQRAWAERTVRVVNAAFPEASSGTGENQRYYLQYYLPHVQECAALIEQYHLHSQEAAQLLFQAGAFLHFHGFYAQSQSLHQQCLTIREHIIGPEHPAVAESLNALAILASDQGDYERTERFYRQALAMREKTLGPQHPVTAESLNNLGVLYRTLGKYEQAEPLLQQALSIHEQSLGFENPKTLNFVINLAKLYIEQRKYEQAEHLLNQALATGERVLGPEHPLIAHNLSLLAQLSFEQRNDEQAEFLWKRSLSIIEQTLGSEHLAVAERLRGLAELYFAQNRYLEAQSLSQRALSIREKILGPENPEANAVREQLNRIWSKIEEEQDSGNHPAPFRH